MEIIIATHNINKAQEFKSKLIKEYSDATFLCLEDVKFMDEIEETGSTFEQNALIKAQAIVTQFPNHIIIADDSGLEVDELNGAPGVYSARYAQDSEKYSRNKDQANIEKVLEEMKDKYNRGAQFVTVLCIIKPNCVPVFVKGVVRGELLDTSIGNNGFGYDPIFSHDGLKTFAEMDLHEKEFVSHRGLAIQEMITQNILRG
jgi:XTP/dITP diphosphohydrolase